MAKWKKHFLALALVASLLLGSVQCGFILYPERRGTKNGEIDPVVLVMDCAWLIVGIVPGVVALVVDFATGCIYKKGATLTLDRGSDLTLRLTDPAPADATLAVTVAQGGERATLFSRDVRAGESVGDVNIDLPYEMAGDYTLAIEVNGVAGTSWNLHLVEQGL